MRYRWNEARLAPLTPEPEAAAANGDEEGASAQRPALGALLIEAGLVTAEQIRDALAEGLTTGERLGEVVVRRGYATEERVAQLLAIQWQLRFRKAETISIDPMAIRRLSQADARRLRAVPVWFDDGGLVLAIEEPTTELFAAVKEVLGEVSYVVVARSTLDHLLSSRFLTDDVTPPLVSASAAALEAEEEAQALDAGLAPAGAPAEVETSASQPEADAEFETAFATEQDGRSDETGSVEAETGPSDGWPLEPSVNDGFDSGPADAATEDREADATEGVAAEAPEEFEADTEEDEQGETGEGAAEAAEPEAEAEADLDDPGFAAETATDDRDLINRDAPTENGADDWGNNVVTISSETDMDVAHDEVGSVLNSIEEASTGLRSIQREITSLGDSLRQAREQLAAREAELEAASEARRRDGETIQRLESDLGRRNDLLGALKAKVAELNQAIEAADS